jgi:hypothetical protein
VSFVVRDQAEDIYLAYTLHCYHTVGLHARALFSDACFLFAFPNVRADGIPQKVADDLNIALGHAFGLAVQARHEHLSAVRALALSAAPFFLYFHLISHLTHPTLCFSPLALCMYSRVDCLRSLARSLLSKRRASIALS